MAREKKDEIEANVNEVNCHTSLSLNLYLIVFLDPAEPLGGQPHPSLVPDLLALVFRLLVHPEEFGGAADEKPENKEENVRQMRNNKQHHFTFR